MEALAEETSVNQRSVREWLIQETKAFVHEKMSRLAFRLPKKGQWVCKACMKSFLRTSPSTVEGPDCVYVVYW